MNDDIDDCTIDSITPDGVTVRVSNAVARRIGSAFADMLADAPNYAWMAFRGIKGTYVVTVQRRNGKSPHELRDEAEARAAQLATEAEQLRTDAALLRVQMELSKRIIAQLQKAHPATFETREMRDAMDATNYQWRAGQ